MINLQTKKTRRIFAGLLFTAFLLAGSCQNWMSNDNFMEKIESEVHDANASQITVYVRYAHDKMGKTEPSGNTTMKVDVASKLSAVTADDYGFVKWAAFSTKDFPSNKNHINLTYISEDSYNANFKDKELPLTEIEFSQPTEPTTEVKIKKARNDIFIIPIVAPRPAYNGSVPTGGDYDVVKNTSIRISFTKAIEKSSLYDEEGNPNYSITSASYSGGDDEDQDIEATDITDYFEPTFSRSGKTLTLKLKEKVDENGNKTGELEKLLDNRQRITVTLFEGLCDTDGYAMNGNYTFSFQTGTNTDGLAPIIDVIFGGTGDKCNVFVSFHDVDENGDLTINGVATDAAINAPTDIESTEYTDTLVAQRVYDKLNLFVKATDVIAYGNADINPVKDLKEDNVNAIGIAASLWIDKEGKPVKLDDTNTITKNNYTYISGTIDKNSQMTQLFKDVVPLDKDDRPYTGGTIYTYDVSSLPDGLIKIDVWGIDMTGNSGAPESDGSPNKLGSPYYQKHDNGYKSIFVVKDTTPPDSEKEAGKVISNSEQAPYYWYNSTTLGTMKLYDDDENQIADAGHLKLRSLAKNLQWNFVVGKTTSEPAKNDKGWKLIHNQETGAGIKYELKDAQAPAADGPVDITMFIRDDIGNVSAPVLLKSIMYDNTKPTVTLKKGKGDFVKATGEDTLHVSESDVINQILKVTIAETNENNAGSGIRRLELHVKKDGQEVAVPLDPTTFKVKYVPATVANPTPSSEGVRNIEIATDDAATTDNIKVFKVTDANKITSGTLFIYGITLGDTDGAYEISVDLYDSALNKTPITAVTSMARDTTVPEIKTVQVMDVKARKVYGANEETWWLPYDRFENANSLSKVTLKVTANESGSGLEYLKLADNAEFTENTKLYVGDKLLERGIAYELDTATRTIHLLDWYTPELKNANGGSHVITIENVKLNNINTPAGTTQGNKIKFTVDDFVGKSKSESTITYGNTTATGDVVHADSVAPQIATLTVEDSAKHTTNNPDNKAYDKDNYTDSQTVILYLTLGDTEAGNKGSGVDKVILSDNAVFTGNTEIYVVDGSTETKLTLSTDYEIAADNKSVTFKKVFTETNKLKFTNVNIISATNGTQIIKADVQDFAGIKSAASKDTNAITFDNVAPSDTVANWITSQPGVTTGQEKDMTVDTQSLKIDFTEATAGVKVIKFEIHHDAQPKTNSYGKPFDNANFAIKYTSAEGTKPLVKGTDYEILSNNADTNIKQYIKLNSTYKSGSFIFDNLTLTNGNTQGNYVVEVLLLDAAENKVDCNKVITIDTVRPEITTTLSIPGLVSAKELTTGSTPVLGAAEGTFWLPQTYVDKTGATTDHAPTEIPVYITIKEEGSGIKVITFQESAVLSATNTKLFTVSGTTETEFARSKYTVDETKKTITITDTGDCFKGASEFKLLVKGVGFANIDTTTAASANSIKVKVSDVAMWDSDSMGTPEQTIYSDSRKPDAPQNLTLTDRASSAATKTIAASAGYTNDEIVDMTFTLTDSEKFGSGYHKFVLNGATFIGGDSADKTTMTIKVGNTTISDAEFALSNDGKTLTLKKTGLANDVYAVIRQAVSVELKNVKLDNGTTDGSKPVTLTAYDMTGWPSAAASYTIILDTGIPAIVGNGPFVANHKVGTSPSYYYNPAINVYPHVSSDIETVYGTPVNSIPTFYTATSYSSSGVSQVNGQISLSSPAQYGVVLGFRVTDTYKVRGYNNNDIFMYYKADTNFSLTAEEILSGGTSLYYGSSNRIAPSANYTASQTNYALWFGFTPGNYSAVVLDSAGNVSNVFRFSVVQDTTKPAKSTTAGNANNLNERVLLQMPDNSAKAYTNSAVVVAERTDFPTFNADYMGAYAIRTKKYIIKDTGANKKYKIQLNLGGTYTASTPIRTIYNTDATETTRYTELDATTTSSPIEMYAVSTYYGSWPKYALSSTESGSSWKYAPVVPYGTTFPSGQTHTDHQYSTSSLAYALGHNYFEYESGCPESNAWKIPNTNVTWHNYKYTGSWVTDSGNGIRSQIDSNNNLIIEIPNTQSTAPVSVFLRDGCGNMQYVVCGLYEESGKQIAVSFVIDKKLGYAETNADGAVTQPIIMQNPYMTYKSSGPSVPWPSSTSESGFYWNNNSGNGNQGGNTALGFMKDDVKKATYYNPSLDYSSTDNQYKLGLTLRFDSADYKRGSAEDILFDSSLGKVTDPDPDSNSSNGDYTCRALLYCTQKATVPTYDVIMNAAANTKNEDGGFRTEWVGVRTSNDASETEDSTEENRKYKITQTTILLDYPKPNYTTLGWTVNENNNEPKPYYMWYLFEDRVGNYEIAKVVNSSETNKNVLNGSQTSTTVYDKWLYDNEGPKLLTRTTDVSANNVSSSQTSVNALVATNNGYVPYLSGNNVYVRVTDGADYRAGNLINSNAGWGTTHYVEGATNNRKYEPFMDLKVDEITGVRAFAWSNNSTPPTSRTTAVSDNNTHGDSGSWYAGYAVTNLECYIGASWAPSDDTNPYFDNKTSSSNYYHKYPGTKVNTAIPLSLLSDSAANHLYLHVMDWTGNISTYHMGNSNMKFINDTTYPTRHYTETGTKDKIRSVDNEWLVRSNGSYIYIHIAGLGAGSSTGKKTMQIRLPDEYFTDSGSGYKGLSLSSLDIGSVKRDTTGPYLEVDYNTYSQWSKIATSPTQLNAYYYDNVGNQDRWTLQCIYDTDAPAISSVSLMPESGTTLADTASGAFTSTKAYTHPTSTGPHSDVSSWASGELQEVYVKTTNSSKVKFKITLTEDPGDFGEAKVNKWNGTSWVTVSSTKDSTTWDTTSTTFEMPGYSLDCASTGTYYQIVVTDVSSNASYQYFKLIKDNEAPTFATTTPKPVVTLGRGSIGNIGDTYYYTADASHPLKLSFAIADAGVGSNSTLKKFQYSLNGSTWLPSNAYIEDPSNIELSFTSGDIETIYFKDILGNVTVASASKPGFSYTYTNASGAQTTVNNIPKLTHYTDTPAAPVITTSVKQKQNSSTTYNIVDQVETWGTGLSDQFDDNVTGWSHLYTEKLENVENTILIKELVGKEREKVKITLPAPKSTEAPKIIGYLKSDSALTINSSTASQIGKYSFADTFDYSFEDDLNTEHAENTVYEKYYYAVDIVGNISPALHLYYSYENPHIPKKVAIIDPLNSSTVKTDKNYIDPTVKAQMETDGINFAKIISVDPIKTNTDKNEVKIFSKGFMVVRCTLYKQAGDTYSETPNKIELWDKWGENPTSDRKLRAQSGPINDSSLFKVYSSTEQDTDDRYFCWITFIPGDFGTGENAETFTPYVFDNNVNYNGSNLHGFIKGATCQSGFIPLDPDTTIDSDGNYTHKVGWMLDKEGPAIANTYVSVPTTGTPVNRVYNYRSSGTISLAEDHQLWKDGKTNQYPRNTNIYIKKTGITDDLIGIEKYKTIVKTADLNDVDSGWLDISEESIKWKTNDSTKTACYKIQLPNVETVHSEINLYFRDNFGNESVEYRIGKSDDAGSLWWIVNDLLTKEGAETTIAAPEGGWTADANDYTFTVTPPVGSIIKSITAKVAGQSVNITGLEFNGYEKANGNASPHPTIGQNGVLGGYVNLDNNHNPIADGFINVAGIKVKLDKITQGWNDKSVTIILNGDSGVSKTIDFVPKMTFTANDVDISDANNEVVTLSSSTGAPLETYVTEVMAKVGDTTLPTPTLSSDHTQVTLNGIPPKTWSEQKVTLYINPDGINKSKDVMTIDALTATDFTVTGADTCTSSGEYTITMTDGSELPEIEDSDLSVTGTGASVSWASPVATVTVTQGWTDQTVTLKVKEFEIKTITVTHKNLKDDVIVLKYNNAAPAYTPGTESYDLTIELPSPLTVTSVTKPEGSGITVTWDANNANGVTIGNVEQSWTADTPVNLVINGVTKLVFTVPQRTFTTSDLTSAVSNPAAWAADATYEVTVTATAGAPITSVKLKVDTTETELINTDKVSGLGEGNVVPASGSFKVNLSAIAQTTSAQSVSLVVNDIEKSLFTIAAATNGGNEGGGTDGNSTPDPNLNENRISIAPITLSGGLSDVSKWNYASDSGETGTDSGIMSFITGLFSKNEVDASNATDVSQNKAKKKSTKSAKKQTKASKKAQKALDASTDAATDTAAVVQEIEQIAAQTVTVEPVVIDQAADVAIQAAVEKPEAVKAEVPAIEVSAALPEVAMDTAAPSKAALWIILCAFLAAAAGVIFCLNKRRSKN